MRSALSSTKEKTSGLRVKFNRAFDEFRDGFFRKCLAWAIRLRYLTISLSICALVLSVGLVTGGRVGFTFFPSVFIWNVVWFSPRGLITSCILTKNGLS